jgi:hypothetical protein
MKVLAIDHHFTQDLEALSYVSRERHEMRFLPADYFGWQARRYFPESVWSGLSEYHQPRYEAARQQWRDRATQILHELYRIFAFDLVIAPADTFFYIRDFRAAARQLGVPFIIVLKETTVPPIQMQREVFEVREFFPFVSDFLCLCSDRAKAFWLQAGAPESRVAVTGQARFDYYRQPERWRTWAQLGYDVAPGRPTVLFLSYDPGLYQSESDYLTGRKPWLEMREQTERTLATVAHDDVTVFVKPHPQQPPDDVARMTEHLATLSAEAWGKSIFLLDAQMDARPFVMAADTIVGFQTTTLMEAMIAGKRTVYTQWGALTGTAVAGLIPYDQYADALAVADNPDALERILRGREPFVCGAGLMRERMQIFENFLGPLDGHAAERVWDSIEAFCSTRPSPDLAAVTLQARLRRERMAYALRQLVRAGLLAFVWAGAAVPARFAGRRAAEARRRLEARLARQRGRLRECLRTLKAQSDPNGVLVGSVDEGFVRRLRWIRPHTKTAASTGSS